MVELGCSRNIILLMDVKSVGRVVDYYEKALISSRVAIRTLPVKSPIQIAGPESKLFIFTTVKIFNLKIISEGDLIKY